MPIPKKHYIQVRSKTFKITATRHAISTICECATALALKTVIDIEGFKDQSTEKHLAELRKIVEPAYVEIAKGLSGLLQTTVTSAELHGLDVEIKAVLGVVKVSFRRTMGFTIYPYCFHITNSDGCTTFLRSLYRPVIEANKDRCEESSKLLFSL